MALNWVQGTILGTVSTSVTIVAAAELIYANQRVVSGTITLVQKAVVVATHLMGITSTDDLCRMRLAVVNESVTPTVAEPEDEDKRIKGLYPFARGPVYFSPRRKIDIPSESDLFLVIEKLTGSTSSDIRCHYRFLLHTSLA